MEPKKDGQIVRFHTPMADEDPKQLYVVLELKDDGERSRADIQSLGTAWAFPSITTVLLSDLEVVSVRTADLIGHHVTVRKPDLSTVDGKVVSVSEQKIDLDLSKSIKGVETNVWLTILDNNGLEHRGTLYVSPSTRIYKMP